MNSNSKFHEMEEDKDNLACKIARQIYNYKVRKACASDEYADVYRYRDTLPPHSDLRFAVNQKLRDIQEEINLCNSQIKAYQENDNKAKLIPDRLL